MTAETNPSVGSSTLDRLASGVAAMLEVPLVVASVFEGSRQLLVAAHGLVEPLRSVRWTDEVSPMCRGTTDGGRPIVIQDAGRRLPSAMRVSWGGFKIVGYAGVPLTMPASATSIGALAAIDSERHAWRARDLVVLRAFGDAIAAVLDSNQTRQAYEALERTLAHERMTAESELRRAQDLEVAALRDELTGLLNRRGFHVVVERELACARQLHVPGLLLSFDLDGLKTTNDRHGHAAGDDLLRRAAAALRDCFRDADVIARIGGDEFVVLVRDAGEKDLAPIAHRLRDALLHDNGGDARPVLAWSIGAVEVDPDRNEPIGVLLAEADRRMYRVKRDTHPDLSRESRVASSTDFSALAERLTDRAVPE